MYRLCFSQDFLSTIVALFELFFNQKLKEAQHIYTLAALFEKYSSSLSHRSSQQNDKPDKKP